MYDKCIYQVYVEAKQSASVTGRFELAVPEWSCPGCGYNVGVTDDDMMKCGFYRASPVNLSTVVHEDVFFMWQSLKHHSPGTSLGAFLAMVQDVGIKHGLVSCDY